MMHPEIYQATIEHNLPRTTPVSGCGCDWTESLGGVDPIDDCSLTPGDQSPAGRCPRCDALVYIDTRATRAKDEAEAMQAILETLAFAQVTSRGMNVLMVASHEILARIKGDA